MFETGKSNALARKAFEIAYALFRLSARMSDQNFAGSLREEATRLMSDAAKNDLEGTRQAATVIEYFIKLAGEVDLVSFANTEILTREIANVRAIIDACPVIVPLTTAVNIADIFSPASPTGEQVLFAKEKNRMQEAGDPASQTAAPSGIRQTAILDLIRQSGNCRIADIQALLPDCSERTLRYDLQSLAERGFIERIGNGGPAVFYQIRQPAGVGLAG